MKGYRKILIAVNGSKNVITQGLKLAREEKCWVTVVKVMPENEGDLDLVGVRDIKSVLDSGASKVLADIKETAKTEGTLIKMRLEEGDVYKKIVEVAEEENCDLIIMGAQKIRKGFNRLFRRNTVGKVIDSAPCPVLVIGA
jgi:nucleotide-binding universal stress UspA family protein